jgi:predicted nucleotidyltransferase
MIQKYSIWRVLRVFFDDPSPREGFTIRYISREIGLAPTSVKLHLDLLASDRGPGYPLVTRSRGISYPVYTPNRNSDLFRFYKRMDMIFRLEESGLLEKIWNACSPDSIILFGSASRGEDVRESDIDLLVGSKEKSMDLKRFGGLLRRRISLHFAPDFGKLPNELKNNILNGVMLRGYLKVF